MVYLFLLEDIIFKKITKVYLQIKSNKYENLKTLATHVISNTVTLLMNMQDSARSRHRLNHVHSC